MRYPLRTHQNSLVRGCRDSVAICASLYVIGFTIALALCFSGAAFSQGPGTPPPESIFDANTNNESNDSGLKVRGFFMLDESGVPIMVTKLTYERWKEIEAGLNGTQQLYAFQSMEVTGTADGGRAELEVTLRFSVDVTDGRLIPIPLKMGNFHCVSAPDVTGVDEHNMASAPDNGGYILSVRADRKRNAVLKMKVATRVDVGATSSLQFRLPSVPSTVRLDVTGKKVTPEIVGRGDEVWQTQPLAGNDSRIVVESGGGTFLLRWGGPGRQDDTTPQLEIESDVDIRWVAPEDQPSASVLLVVRNLRGVVSEFDIRLPPGCILLDAPMLVSSGQYIDVPGTINSDTQKPIKIIVPEEEQQQRIDVKLELQLANTKASANAPLILQIPDVVGAIRHNGEIQIRTGADYRLRWLSRQWIQSIANSSTEEPSSSRRYSFHFDRGGLNLPIYLSAKERQVRLTSSTDLLLTESLATLETTINASGQAFDGRGLNVDLRGWQLRSIVDTETGEELEHFSSGQIQEIEMNSGGADDSAPVRIVAERALPGNDIEFGLPLPSIVKTDENQVLKTATVTVRSTGRAAFVLDLVKSTGLDRLGTEPDFGPIRPNVHRLRVLPPDASATVSGMMVRQAPRIDLASSAKVQLDANELQTTVDWTVTSLVDLEGRMPIEIPNWHIASMATSNRNLFSEESAPIESNLSQDFDRAGEPGDSDLTGMEDPASQWNVTVEDSTAVLRHVEGTRYELISDRLTDGTYSIRWWNGRTIDKNASNKELQWIVLPRPRVADISMQGATRVSLLGDQENDLQSVGSNDKQSYLFESLPREPLRVRIARKTALVSELSIKNAVLRTAIGRNVRYEQLLATVQGDEYLEIGLPTEVGDIKAEVFVDQNLGTVRREADRLVITLAMDKELHSVDLRVWIDEDSSPWFLMTQPKLQIPRSAGRIFWQVVSPLDCHVVWAAPTLGRAMNWQLDQWRLARVPLRSDQMLAEYAGIDTTKAMPPGNRSLYIGMDPSSFQVVTATRGQLWAIVAGIVLAVSSILIYVPSTRHPFSAVIASIALAGLIAVAPDSAVLAGQFAMIALALVVVMTSIRALMTPRRSARVFRQADNGQPTPSTRTIKQRVPVRERNSARDKIPSMTTTSLPVATGELPTATELEVGLGQPHDSGASQGSSKLPPPTEVIS